MQGEGPLSGRTIVVTRSRAQAADLVARLESLGAEVLEFPTIATVDPDSWDAADKAVRGLESYDWVVFTSANGVDGFFKRVTAAGRDARAFAGCRVAAVGPATAARAEAHGVTPDFVPEEHVAEGVLAGLCERGVGGGTRVLVPRALEAREVLPDTLRERGAIVDVVPVYRTVPGPGDPAALARMEAYGVDAVVVTSASTVRNFLALVEGTALAPERLLFASIGPVTTKAARERGLTVAVEPDEYTVPALVEALARRLGPGGDAGV